jgi:2-amino-4-hydroxy-6-hydroxymethyldihydropteridine diphosphokinase
LSETRYLIALGSNQRHHRFGHPRAVLTAALVALECAGIAVITASRWIETPPLGPSRRRYANGAAVVEFAGEPDELLARLKAIEAAFGPRRGQRWSARVLDLDIVLWSGGCWAGERLTVPHIAFRTRRFVLAPVLDVARDWRDPLSALSIAQLHARLTHARPAPIGKPLPR